MANSKIKGPTVYCKTCKCNQNMKKYGVTEIGEQLSYIDENKCPDGIFFDENKKKWVAQRYRCPKCGTIVNSSYKNRPSKYLKFIITSSIYLQNFNTESILKLFNYDSLSSLIYNSKEVLNEKIAKYITFFGFQENRLSGKSSLPKDQIMDCVDTDDDSKYILIKLDGNGNFVNTDIFIND